MHKGFFTHQRFRGYSNWRVSYAKGLRNVLGGPNRSQETVTWAETPQVLLRDV